MQKKEARRVMCLALFLQEMIGVYVCVVEKRMQ